MLFCMALHMKRKMKSKTNETITNNRQIAYNSRCIGHLYYYSIHIGIILHKIQETILNALVLMAFYFYLDV